MKHLYTLLSFILLNAFVYAQQMPIDFSSSSDNFNTWGGSSFAILPSPTNADNLTGEFFRSASANLQGHFIDLSQPIDLDEEDEITMRFYAFDANNHDVVVALENGSNPDIEVEVSTTANNSWSDLTFDFSTVSGTGTYGRLVIRIDDGSTTPGAFRIDDINDGSTPGDEHAIDVEYTDLVWSDEFDGTTLDLNNWYRQTFGPNNGQWFNGELQHYTDSDTNSFVADGNLHIVAKKETTTQNEVTLDYTSARLNSKFAFTYGRVDVRAKLPEGSGTWPAIWTLGKNISEPGAYWETQGFGTTSWPACGELDIMEHGLHATDEVSCAIHTPSSFGNTVNTEILPLPDVSENYHVYSMNWSPDQITFLVDGVGYYTYHPAIKDPDTWPFDLDQYLILNVAMGGFAGNIDPDFTQSSMIVDYVRVYQNVLDTEDFSASEIVIYPNPSSDIIYIESEMHFKSLKLCDIQGRQIYSSNTNLKSINAEEYKAGIYFITIESEKVSIVKKVIIK
jgi:beta-glucanase (GH16 family)